MRRRLIGWMLLLLLGTASVSGGAPCGDDPRDAAAVATVRAGIESACGCAAAHTHGAHVGCAKAFALGAVRAKTLPPQCLKGVVRCAARSTCGRPGAVSCCLTHAGTTRCRRASSAARCVARGGCPSAFASCCDACGVGGCATTSTTSTTSSSSTSREESTTTSTTLCPPVCGNGVCEQGESNALCPLDCPAPTPGGFLPATLGSCLFDAYAQSGNCADLPQPVGIPDALGNTCFSSLSADPANVFTLIGYLPTACGGGGQTPALSVGQQVNVASGQLSILFSVLDDCFRAGIRDFVVPITQCGSCGQVQTIVGFAHVRLQVINLGVGRFIGVTALCPSCGDGFCEPGETCDTCSADCTGCAPVCE